MDGRLIVGPMIVEEVLLVWSRMSATFGAVEGRLIGRRVGIQLADSLIGSGKIAKDHAEKLVAWSEAFGGHVGEFLQAERSGQLCLTH